MTQVNLRLPEDLKKIAENFARKHGYGSIQELTKEALREKIYEKESLKETLEIMRDKKLMASIARSREDVRKGRVISWEELQKRWKTKHAKG